MVTTVQSEKCCRRVCWIWLSVAVSSDAVASSRTKTLLFLSSTGPRHTSCLGPILQFSPFSVTCESSFPFFFLTSSPSWHLSKASQICSSACSSRGSRLLQIVPSNMVGSWGMMLSLVLKSCSPINEISLPSIKIWPTVGSTIWKSVWMRLDLPLPLLPMMPVFTPPCKVHVRPRNTSGKFGAYRTYKWRMLTSPCDGQELLGLVASITRAGSLGIQAYWSILSTDIIFLSTFLISKACNIYLD